MRTLRWLGLLFGLSTLSPLQVDVFAAGAICFLIIGLWVIFILVAIWVYRDAESRGMSGVLWLIVVIILGIIGLIIYLIVRGDHPVGGRPPMYGAPPGGYYAPPPGYPPQAPPQVAGAASVCRNCGTTLPPGAQVCPRCGARVG